MGLGLGGVLEQLIGPPGGFILLALVGLLLMRRHRRAGLACTTSALFLLYVVSMPFTASLLMSWWEPDNALSEQTLISGESPPQAIVILGGGRREDTPEFAGDTPKAYTLERIRYGVWLARRTQLPILVTGGLGDENILSEAELMQRVIEYEYALPVKWLEEQSTNTYENAVFSTKMLKAAGVESIYLVTHAFHMRRSLQSFVKLGFTVVPAPTAFYGGDWRDVSLRHLLPSAAALKTTALVFHEVIGSLWYSLRY